MIKLAAAVDANALGPTLRAIPFFSRSAGTIARILTDRQRQQLARISTREEVPARQFVYHEQSPAGEVFICGRGVAKSFRELPSGTRRVVAFLFPADLFGLAEAGRYVNSVQAVTPALIYRIPVEALADLLRTDPELEFQFLCKVTHELRLAQRRSIVLGRRDAVGRLAMFIQMMAESSPHPTDRGRISLPMTRADIAEFLAMSGEAVSRATTRLVKRGIIEFEGKRTVRIVDRAQFEKIANTP